MNRVATKPFPTEFNQHLEILDANQLDRDGQRAVRAMYDMGFDVTAGVLESDVDHITAIAQQHGVREYCPNDATKRFGSKAMMESWLTKNGGRGMFILRAAGVVAGYGWTGPERSDALPETTTTFAVRLSEHAGATGRGLGSLFTTAIVSGSMALYGAEGIGLETWGSNTKAVRSYLRSGAELVSTQDDVRPTWVSGNSEQRQDIRLFMQFTRTMPPKVYH